MKNTSQVEKGGGHGYIISRNVFVKISAVEGIQLTKEMRADFQSFEQKGLSSSDRRKAITEKYAR